MSEHLTDQQVMAFQQRALPAAELLASDEHLAACSACQQRLGEVCAADAGFAAVQAEVLSETPPMHLEFEQLADFVDGRLQAEMSLIVNDHLAVCGPCRLAAEDLRGFSRAVADDLKKSKVPATQPVVTASWWQNWQALLGQRWALSLGTAAALVLIFGVAWLARRVFFPPVAERMAVVEPTPLPVIKPEATPAAAAMPEAPPNLLAQLNDGGGQLRLNEQGALLGADEMPARFQALLKQSLSNQRVSRSSNLSGLGSPAGALMSGGTEKAAFGLLSPVAKVLLTDQPELRWQALAGATSYQVEIVDENFNVVASSGALTTNAWRVSKPLPRGHVYAWQVTALKEGQTVKAPQPPAPLARFRVIAQKEADDLQQARQRFGSSHLLLGQLYAQAGLLDEAEREFRALQKANPTAALPKKLLAQLRHHAAQ